MHPQASPHNPGGFLNKTKLTIPMSQRERCSLEGFCVTWTLPVDIHCFRDVFSSMLHLLAFLLKCASAVCLSLESSTHNWSWKLFKIIVPTLTHEIPGWMSKMAGTIEFFSLGARLFCFPSTAISKIKDLFSYYATWDRKDTVTLLGNPEDRERRKGSG